MHALKALRIIHCGHTFVADSSHACIADAYGSYRDLGDPWPPNYNWDSRCDFDRDGDVDYDDLFILADNYGKRYW